MGRGGGGVGMGEGDGVALEDETTRSGFQEASMDVAMYASKRVVAVYDSETAEAGGEEERTGGSCIASHRIAPGCGEDERARPGGGGQLATETGGGAWQPACFVGRGGFKKRHTRSRGRGGPLCCPGDERPARRPSRRVAPPTTEPNTASWNRRRWLPSGRGGASERDATRLTGSTHIWPHRVRGLGSWRSRGIIGAT